jgi:hypothetical protein
MNDKKIHQGLIKSVCAVVCVEEKLRVLEARDRSWEEVPLAIALCLCSCACQEETRGSIVVNRRVEMGALQLANLRSSNHFTPLFLIVLRFRCWARLLVVGNGPPGPSHTPKKKERMIISMYIYIHTTILRSMRNYAAVE